MSEVSAPPPAPTQDDALTPPTFDVLPLSPETRASLDKMGFVSPTPVQRAVFEPASRGRDLVVQARTGTGKTVAFGLPIVEHLVRRSQPVVQALCLCPTRELALQVAGEIERLGEGRQIKPVAVYGGAPMGRQVDALRGGAQVIVGTPGRVLDHIKRGSLKPGTIRALVLDEADEMLSMGFERELTAILDALPKDRQTLLFSATVPPDIERMARERLRQPEFITLSSDAVGALSISHFVYFILEEKLPALLRILDVESPESAIIFCNTKIDTEAVAGALQRSGYDADWLNGDLAQDEREKVVTRIRNGTLRFLVATDVAARGIDISHLSHVINYDFPDSTESYVHRTGRTGRAGRTGTAISLVRPQDIGNLYFLRLAYGIRPFERFIPTSNELKTRREADLVQSLVDSFRDQTPHPDDVQLARRLLSHDRAETVVAQLIRERLGERVVAEGRATAERRAKNPAPFVEPTPGQAGESTAREAPARAPERSRDRNDRGPSRGHDRDRGRNDRGFDRPRGDRNDRGFDRPRGDRNDRGGERGGDRGFDRRPSSSPRGDERGPSRRGPSERSDDGLPRYEETPLPAAEPLAAAVAPEVSSHEPPAVETPAPAPAAPPPFKAPAAPRMALPFQAPPAVETPVAASPEPSPAPPAPPAERKRRPTYSESVAATRTPEAREPAEESPEAVGASGPTEASSEETPSEGGGRRRRRRRGGGDRAREASPVSDEDLGFRYTVSDATPGASAPSAGEQAPRPRPARPAAPAAEAPPAAMTIERPSDLVNWHPPEEANDDQPIWGSSERRSEESEGDDLDEQNFALVFLDVGRREGVRPSDLQRALRDRAGIGRRDTGRIRVRDRHSLVAVRRELMERAIEGLTGAEIGGRTVRAEAARERGAEND